MLGWFSFVSIHVDVDLSGSLDGSVGVGYFEAASSGMLLCLFGGSETEFLKWWLVCDWQ
jgi:hypothetical protein